MSHPSLFVPNFKDDTISPTTPSQTTKLEDNHSEGSADSEDHHVGVSLSDIIEGDDNDQISDDEDEPESEESSCFDLFMKIFVCIMVSAAWYFVVFFLNRALKPGFMGSKGSEIFISFFSFMALISYFKCTFTSSVNHKQNGPQSLIIADRKTCKPCHDKWKPERTHHCRWCKKCVLRMDHHCPWICNCVGYKNHKAFILFCFYIGVGSVYFDYRAIYYFFWASNTATDIQFSFFYVITCLLCFFVIAPIGAMALGLFIYHFLLAMSNLTTLEHMKGGYIDLPCRSSSKKLNKYDKGRLVNLAEFFGNTYLLWWWPTTPPFTFKGHDYVPNEPSQREIDIFLENTTGKKSVELKYKHPKSLKDVDVEDYFKQADEYVNDKTLKFNDVNLEKPKELVKKKEEEKKADMKEPYVLTRNSIQDLDNMAEETAGDKEGGEISEQS